MKYQILLLDADGTLLDFQKAEARGLEAAFSHYHLPFDENMLADYSAINKKCWEEFEQGLLDKKSLLVERFRRLFEKKSIHADPNAVRVTYQYELSLGSYLIEHAYEVCEELSKTHDLYIVTNGVASTQHRRLRESGLDKLMKGIFISEEIGCQKPQKEFFHYAFRHIPGFRRESALMIGDSLSADIQGGINAGVDTCWYNPFSKENTGNRNITYEIRDIRELLTIV